MRPAKTSAYGPVHYGQRWQLIFPGPCSHPRNIICSLISWWVTFARFIRLPALRSFQKILWTIRAARKTNLEMWQNANGRWPGLAEMIDDRPNFVVPLCKPRDIYFAPAEVTEVNPCAE